MTAVSKMTMRERYRFYRKTHDFPVNEAVFLAIPNAVLGWAVIITALVAIVASIKVLTLVF